MNINLKHPFVNICNNKEKLLEGVYTLKSFIKNIEKEAPFAQKYIDCESFKGKVFECFVEFLIKSYPKLWISDYIPNNEEDLGIDGFGIGLNNKPATIQIKYRSNTNSELNANDDHLSNFVSNSIMRDDKYRVDQNDTKNMLIFTTAKGIHYVTTKMHYGKVVCIGYKEISQLVDNNIPFWDSFRTIFYTTNKKAININQKALYKHQKEALKSINKNSKGIINLPTGTGKTTIVARSIIEKIKAAKKNNIVLEPIVISSPRIILTKQILVDIQTELLKAKVEALYCVVNSGNTKDNEEVRELEQALNFTHQDLVTTTIPSEIKKIYKRAKLNNLPLIICAVYNSVGRIMDAKLPISNIYCDEAHYLLNEEFNYITDDINFVTSNKYYFTATLRETVSNTGLGMNNSSRYGQIIYQKSPAEMIREGIIVRPRLHVISSVNSFIKAGATPTQLDAIDPHAIITAFEEHKACCHQYSDNGVKLLVICKGTKHLEGICKSKYLENYCKKHKNLSIFSISSEGGAKIGSQNLSREDWLKELKSLKDTDDAIIFHIDILSEGIDVPGITGILPLTSMKISKMLQNLGRATRLNKEDRERLIKKELSTNFKTYDVYGQCNEALAYNKPYAYIIIPHYTELNLDLKDIWEDAIYTLRQYGASLKEDVIMTEKRGIKIPKSIQLLNQEKEEVKGITAKIIELENIIEEEEKANEFYENMNKCTSLTELSALFN